VRNEVLCSVKEERIITNKTKRRKTNWIGHNVPMNCLLNMLLKGR
jgi:hypothetical protein